MPHGTGTLPGVWPYHASRCRIAPLSQIWPHIETEHTDDALGVDEDVQVLLQSDDAEHVVVCGGRAHRSQQRTSGPLSAALQRAPPCRVLGDYSRT